jgi:hypothetical protein
MAKNLKKFVNLKFLNTCDLELMYRLMSRHAAELRAFDLGVLKGDSGAARDALRNFFAGPERDYPKALTADLHHIADLGSQHGMRVLLERAKAVGITLVPAADSEDHRKVDPKHLALRAFLDHRALFNAASDLVALDAMALTEFRGAAEDIEATLNDKTKEAFERAAKQFFSAELMGGYCRIGWYDDGDEINIVVVHGTVITTEWVIENNSEEIISFRPAGTTVLTYDPVEGRLKLGGLAKAQRMEFAELFAATLLDRPGFFGRDDSQDLYTLEPIERSGFGFQFDHKFDPGILSVKVMEAQADRLATAKGSNPGQKLWSILVKDRSKALQRMGQVASTIAFGPNAYRLAHVGFRVEFDSETKPHPRVTVKLAPPQSAKFRREFFEGRIMELLRRNGLCLERQPDEAAIAAQ